MANLGAWGHVVSAAPGMTAIITVHGPQQLVRAFRKRAKEMFEEEVPEATLIERPGTDSLCFDFASPTGVPFPTLVTISTRYPDCLATIQWTMGSASGETTIQNGQVKEASRAAQLRGPTPQFIAFTPVRTLRLALAIDIERDGLMGYAATGAAETWFRIHGDKASHVLYTIGGDTGAWDEKWAGAHSQCTALEPPLPLTKAESTLLGDLSTQFRAEWLWFAHAPEEDTIVERMRYSQAAMPVAPINVKSIKLAAHREEVMSSLPADQDWITDLLLNTWARPEQS